MRSVTFIVKSGHGDLPVKNAIIRMSLMEPSPPSSEPSQPSPEPSPPLLKTTLSICGRTDDNGFVSFTVPKGIYEAVAYHSDKRLSGGIHVDVNDINLSQDITMENLSGFPTGGIVRVIVVDTLNYNQPVSGITVEFRNPNNGNAVLDSGVTDSLGYVQLNIDDDAPFGLTGDLVILANPQAVYEVSVSSNSDQTIVHNIHQ